jgi:quercetin dioxygenase-like cupin family protein
MSAGDVMTLTNTVSTADLSELIEFDEQARLVRKKIFQSETIVSELVCYEPGQFTKTHVHPNQDEIFFCMEGRGIITFEDRDDVGIEKGSIVFVPKGTRHGVDTIDGERLTLVFTKGPGLPNPRKREV